MAVDAEKAPGLRVAEHSPDLADTITEPGAAEAMRAYRAHALDSDAIARAVSYALTQPADVDVNEIIVRPARQR